MFQERISSSLEKLRKVSVCVELLSNLTRFSVIWPILGSIEEGRNA